MSRRPNGLGRPGQTPRPRARLPRVEALEDRLLLSTFTVRNTDDNGVDSLRRAILNANANVNAPGDVDRIEFDIPLTDPGFDNTTGTWRIAPTAVLPPMTEAVVIDGYTQGSKSTDLSDDARPNTLRDGDNAVLRVELSGAGVMDKFPAGLKITAGGSTVRGLVINGFGGPAIELSGSGGNTIVGNFIGTDAAGTSVRSNGLGILVFNDANAIGGTAPADRNLISGNDGDGITIDGSGASGNRVQGNFIGTDVTGTTTLDGPPGFEGPTGNIGNGVRLTGGAFGNTIGAPAAGTGNLIAGNGDPFFQASEASTAGVLIESGSTNNLVQGNFIGTDGGGTASVFNFHGVLIDSSDANTIGGTMPGAGNLISGHAFGVGVSIFNSSGTWVQGNRIGTDASGGAPVPNATGVEIDGSDNTIGGLAPGAGNTIAFNEAPQTGVAVYSGTGNAILSNSIFGNSGLGINLVNDDDVTLNDPDGTDDDIGPNDLQNYPVLTGVIINAGQTIISGTIVSTPDTDFLIQVFASDVVDQSGFGEGQKLLGTRMVRTDSGGSMSFSLPVAGRILGQVFTATATKVVAGVPRDTSEFGPALEGPSLVVVTGTGDAVADDAVTTLREAITFANNHPGPDVITFRIPTGPFTIRPDSALPPITGPVLIDGTSQPGFASTPIIELDGSNAGAGVSGLTITAGESTVQGLVLNRFGGDGIVLMTGGGNTLRGNFIGTDVTGTAPAGNLGVGVVIDTGSSNSIGGTAPGAGNIIAFNGRSGVSVRSGTGNALRFNSIFSNAGLGIDLGGDDLTSNDAGDRDSGPNGFQNFPVLTAAVSSGGSTVISGTLNSAPGTTFQVDFFADAADPSGFGEGREFLGTTTVTTDASGNMRFSTRFPAGVPPGRFVTATATDSTNNTSEFSRTTVVVAGFSFTVVNTDDSGPGSLRQAILDANTVAGMQTIDFAIPSPGPYTITLASALPDITEAVIIDGTTQKGASPNTRAVGDNAVLLVELSGVSLAPGIGGLRIAAGGTTVRGLAINRFGGPAIDLVRKQA